MKAILNKFNKFLRRKIDRKIQIQKSANDLRDKIAADVEMYNLIQQKKSDLPKKQRDLVIARIDAYIALGYIIIQKESDHE